MKAFFSLGLVVFVIGIFAFVVPVPHSEHHGISAGDLHVGVKTEHSDRLPPAVGIVLIAAGAGMMIAGHSKGR